jgi:hypothetical protein
MPLPAEDAARRRDLTLARTRRLSLWVAGSAAAAAIGLGMAFADALPGHHAPVASAQPGAGQPAATQSRGTPPASPRPASSGHLAQPSRPPATTPAQPQAVSGGS